MEIEYIIPQSLSGPPGEENLWLACSLCNDHKGDRIAALDPVTDEIVRLFDPRRQSQSVIALNLNRPLLMNARRAWYRSVGIHQKIDTSLAKHIIARYASARAALSDDKPDARLGISV